MQNNVLLAVIYAITFGITVAYAPHQTGSDLIVPGAFLVVFAAYMTIVSFLMEKKFDSIATHCVIFACWFLFFASWYSGVYQALYHLVA